TRTRLRGNQLTSRSTANSTATGHRSKSPASKPRTERVPRRESNSAGDPLRGFTLMKRVAFLTLAAGLVVCMVVSENFAQPGGGSWQSGSGGGSYTTKGGSTINYGGGAVGGTTGGGVTGGKYVGGVQVTTPGGQTINKVGSGGAATGPGGVTAGSKGSITGT